MNASEVRYRRLSETAKDEHPHPERDTDGSPTQTPSSRNCWGIPTESCRQDALGNGPLRDVAASRNAFRKLQRKEYIRYDNLPLETKGRRAQACGVCQQYLPGERHESDSMQHSRHHRAPSGGGGLGQHQQGAGKTRGGADGRVVDGEQAHEKDARRGEAGEEEIKSRERLRNLSGRLQSLLEEERTRISREIHDELGQALTALKIDLSLTEEAWSPADMPSSPRRFTISKAL